MEIESTLENPAVPLAAFGEPPPAPSHGTLARGEDLASSLLCSRHPAQAKQPFWPEHLLARFVPVADAASEKFEQHVLRR